MSCVACQKPQHEVWLLVGVRDDIAICQECIGLCAEVVVEHRPLFHLDGVGRLVEERMGKLYMAKTVDE